MFRNALRLTAAVLGVAFGGPFFPALAADYGGWTVGDASGGYGTILHTDDNGDTWTRQGQPGEIPDIRLASVSAADPFTAWVVGGNIGGYGTILHTTDGGRTWRRQGTPAQTPDVELLKVKAVNRRVAWAAGYAGTVLRTTNGGDTWQQVNKAPIPDVMLQGLDALDARTAWVSGEPYQGEGAIFHTADGGASWTKQGSAEGVPADSHFIGIGAADENHAWAVGGGGFLVIHTQDGGASWTLQSGTVGQINDANEAFAVDERTAWIAQDYDNILLTLDGGTTWFNRAPDPVTGRFMMGVSAADADRAWVCGVSPERAGGVIVRTTDGGLNWDRQTPPAPQGGVPPGLWGISMTAQSEPIPTLSLWGALTACLLVAGSAFRRIRSVRAKTA